MSAASRNWVFEAVLLWETGFEAGSVSRTVKIYEEATTQRAAFRKAALSACTLGGRAETVHSLTFWSAS